MKSGLLSKIGSFVSASVLSLSMMGCNPVLPTPVSISNDGKHISYASTDEGNVYLLSDVDAMESAVQGNQSSINLTMMTYDVAADSIVNKVLLDETPISVTNSRGHVAYNFAEKNENSITDYHIAFINNGRKKIIKNATFPVLSQAGDCLAYTEGEEYTIYLDYFKKGNLKNTHIRGFPLAFSPDLKSLLYMLNEDKDYGLEIYDLSSGKTNHIYTPTMRKENSKGPVGLPFYPQWVDNDKVLFQWFPSSTSKTTEIYVVDSGANLTRITKNDREELTPMISANGEIFYASIDPENKDVNDFPVYYSRNEKGFWKEHKTNFEALWTRVSGDELVYVSGKERGKIRSVPLEDVIEGNKSNIEDISADIEANIAQR